MNKGDRVRVVRGRKSKGVEGTIFWEGPNKYGEGTRLGLKDAEGETHWVASEHVELLGPKQGEEAAPKQGKKPAPGPTGPAADESQLKKGARVRWGSSEGVIFWVGQNKFGPGLRLGVTGDDQQKHWLNAAEVQLVGEAPQQVGGQEVAQPVGEEEVEGNTGGLDDDQDDDWANREDDRDYNDDSVDGEEPL